MWVLPNRRNAGTKRPQVFAPHLELDRAPAPAFSEFRRRQSWTWRDSDSKAPAYYVRRGGAPLRRRPSPSTQQRKAREETPTGADRCFESAPATLEQQWRREADPRRRM